LAVPGEAYNNRLNLTTADFFNKRSAIHFEEAR